MADPQLPVNTVKMAYRGQSVNLDRYPARGLPQVPDLAQKYDFSEEGLDYAPSEELDPEDLRQLNGEILALRSRLHKIRNEQRIARRRASYLRWKYDQAKKRALIQVSGADAKQREAVAEIMCEPEYGEWIVTNTVADELQDLSRSLRVELDTLRELSYNARRQLDIDLRS